MIAETGLAALWLAASLALLQLVLALVGLKGDKPDLLAAVRPAAVAQGVLTAIAFALLITLFLVLVNIFNNVTNVSPNSEGMTAISSWMLGNNTLHYTTVHCTLYSTIYPVPTCG